MTEATLTIGTVAKQAGVNVETIRYYQRRNLLPVPSLPAGSVRHYSVETVQRVRF
ncbi:MAG TPA: MerR family transcriptional regulator, partial [Burkholderiales bacterium]|nr:MerR family transcriptional regulator [Burkholderiales bacterium]